LEQHPGRTIKPSNLQVFASLLLFARLVQPPLLLFAVIRKTNRSMLLIPPLVPVCAPPVAQFCPLYSSPHLLLERPTAHPTVLPSPPVQPARSLLFTVRTPLVSSNHFRCLPAVCLLFAIRSRCCALGLFLAGRLC
jgi:hypothetical protein